MRKFSFHDRLKGWKIEIRQREKGDIVDSVITNLFPIWIILYNYVKPKTEMFHA